MKRPKIAARFAGLDPLWTQQQRSEAEYILEKLIEGEDPDPKCDPDFGDPRQKQCEKDPPAPPIARHVLSALDFQGAWLRHPDDAVESVRDIASTYEDAIASKLPGATAAQQRLVKALEALRGKPCGPNKP